MFVFFLFSFVTNARWKCIVKSSSTGQSMILSSAAQEKGQMIKKNINRNEEKRNEISIHVVNVFAVCSLFFLSPHLYLNDNKTNAISFSNLGHFDTKQTKSALTDSWIECYTKLLWLFFSEIFFFCLLYTCRFLTSKSIRSSVQISYVMSVWAFDVQNYRIIF